MKSKQVIITNGSGGCGKDSIAKFIQEYYTMYKYSSICKVKDIAAICGAEPDENGYKSEKLRKFWSDLKLLTVDYNDMPMNDLCLIYNKFIENDLDASINDKYSGLRSDYPSAQLLIIDIREPAEIQKAVDKFDAITMLVTRPDVDQIKSNMADANVNNFKYDYEIINDGTLEDLRNKVLTFIDWLEERNNGG